MMNLPSRHNSYTLGTGTATSAQFFFPKPPRDPNLYDTGYDLYTGWVNLSTHAIWYLETLTASQGQVTATWRSVGPVVVASVDPASPLTASSDYLYPIGQIWVNSSTDDAFMLLSYPSGTTAYWIKLSSGGTASEEFIPDTGTSPVVPNGSGQINVKGQNPASQNGIIVTGGTNELDFALYSPFKPASGNGSYQFISTSGAVEGTVETRNTSGSNGSMFSAVAHSGVGVSDVGFFSSGQYDVPKFWNFGMTPTSSTYATAFNISSSTTQGDPSASTVAMSIAYAASPNAVVLIPSGDLQVIRSQNPGGPQIALANSSAVVGSTARVVIATNGSGVGSDCYMLFQQAASSATSFEMGVQGTAGGSQFVIQTNPSNTHTYMDGVNVLSISTTQVVSLLSGQTWNVTTPGAYPYNVVIQDLTIAVDTTAGRTINLPAAPVAGQIHVIKDLTGTAAANNITVQGNGHNIDGAASYAIATNFGSAMLQYNGTSTTWMAI